MSAAFAIFLLLALMLLGIPIATALGIAGVATLFVFDLGYQMAGVNFVSGIASFPLLAIPFFVLAGVILEKAGLAAKIAKFFELLVGKSTGGFAVVSVVTCIFWGALSGSGPATTAAIGLLLIGHMIRHGYKGEFAAATIANASGISIIIPPSIAFIIYGNLTGTSVSALFMAGVIPGLLMGIGIGGTAWWICMRRGYRGLESRGSSAEIFSAFRGSIWALLAPVIILGGIYLGIFTPTEAAVVAVFYSLFVAMIIYRTIRPTELIQIFVDASVTSSVIMAIVVFAGIFSWAASTTGLIDAMANFLVAVSPNAVIMIMLVNLLLLFLGMFLDAISISYLILPILMPVLAVFRIDPLWYGVVFITALAIGQTTPPVGVNLFTAANLVGSDIDSVSREVVPYVLVNILVLIILSLVPGISLFLPMTLGLYSLP